MIKTKHFESICMYLPILVVCILLGAQVRTSIISKGVDDFTAKIIFMVVICVGVIIYASISLFLQGLYDIVKRFLDKSKETAVVSEALNLSPIANLKEELKNKETQNFNNRLEVALKYTQEQFALYTSEEDLEYLSEYVIKYSRKEKLESVKPIVVHTLSNIDLYHFGWNIWKHFGKRHQDEIAFFLKAVFAGSFVDAGPKTIKSHLRDDESKGIIKIRKDLTA